MMDWSKYLKSYYVVLDPLTVPSRRETSHRKAKGRSALNAMQRQTLGLDNQADDFDEPAEFVDSDSDPAWTPQKVVVTLIIATWTQPISIFFISLLTDTFRVMKMRMRTICPVVKLCENVQQTNQMLNDVLSNRIHMQVTNDLFQNHFHQISFPSYSSFTKNNNRFKLILIRLLII